MLHEEGDATGRKIFSVMEHTHICIVTSSLLLIFSFVDEHQSEGFELILNISKIWNYDYCIMYKENLCENVKQTEIFWGKYNSKVIQLYTMLW